MRFHEIHNPLQAFSSVVRIVTRDDITFTCLCVHAESQQRARKLLSHRFGEGNILSVTQQMTEEGPKVLSPQEQQVKSMSDQAKRLQQQAKQVKARSKLQKAQQQLAKATTQSVDD